MLRNVLAATVAAALCTACGSGRSILIAADDPLYRRALDHLERTRRAVAETAAPDDDQAIFMQAEGLYRYRFAPPPRSAAAYIAETAASLIDLPALETFAGSLDLYALRLKTFDGAAQLWETLLARDPATPLAPLALYRLGWAYRNTMVSGLPRDSDAAFAQLVEKFPATPLARAAAEAREVPWKSQDAATAWSIVPGFGQMYAGAYGSGTVRLTIALAALAAIITPTVIAVERRHDLSWSHDWPLLASGIGGAIVLTIDYSSSYQDALRRVLEFNERTEAAFDATHGDAP